MAKIQILDQKVAELIAAGEVVERPASIVKELLENSIDAGADQITVEIKGGGIGYIRVADNGSGIEREDLPRAFVRHATSKVRSEEDLGAIATLGFRGEALASIAAVARVELTTHAAGEDEGSVVRIEGGGALQGPRPAGCPQGTTLIIRDLFYNTPARMKFLRKDVSEGNAVAQIVDRVALSHPEIAFRFIRDTQTKLQTSGNGDLLSVIAAVYGRELASGMIPVDYTLENRIHVSGYVGDPSISKTTRTYQSFFLNGRYIRARTCSAALEEAYKNRILSGRFPVCVLDLITDPSSVDVNVHPAKTEVRFSEERAIFHAIFYGVKSAFSSQAPPLEQQKESTVTPLTLHLSNEIPVQQRLDPVPATVGGVSDDEVLFSSSTRGLPTTQSVKQILAISDKLFSPRHDTVQASPIQAQHPLFEEVQEEEEQPLPDARLIGELFGTYILLEQGDDLVIVDKHAAHEGILYERIRREIHHGNRQVLLEPVAITLGHAEYGVLLNCPETLADLGILVEDFGNGTLLVREVPIEMESADLGPLLEEIAQKLLLNNRDLTPTVLERLCYSIACKSAVRAGDHGSRAELVEIVRLLSQNPHIAHCPHGRPIVARVNRRNIEKMTGRLG